MPGKGCLRLILIMVIGLGVIADGADIVARHWATGKIEQRVKAVLAESQGVTAQGVHAHIRSFPFLKVVVTGHVDELGGNIDALTVGPLTFNNVDVEVHGLRVDAGKVLKGKVVVQRIASGTVSATVTTASLVKILGVPASVIASTPVTVSVRSSSRQLVVQIAGGVSLPFNLPPTSVLPCLPSVVFTNQAVKMSCTFDHIPSAFTSLA